jgi:tetratricopeptide (TPR) repeat protein
MQAEPIQPEATSTESKVVSAEETVVEELLVEESAQVEASESVTSIAVESPEVTAVAELGSSEAAPSEEEATPQVVAIAPAPVPQGIAAAGSVQKHELDEIVKNELIQAREAFWHRDLAKAETLYAELTAKQSDNPDIWGELGNVYLAQNKVKEAADAYYKAAEILIDEGRLRQVGQLMGVIQMAEPAKAQALDQKIRKLYQQTGTMR